jgi:hypothetical protein
MPENDYMDKKYCLECATKHANRLEHHYEDIVSASKDDPQMRQNAQNMLDKVRELRKETDEMRINELAKGKLKAVQ